MTWIRTHVAIIAVAVVALLVGAGMATAMQISNGGGDSVQRINSDPGDSSSPTSGPETVQQRVRDRLVEADIQVPAMWLDEAAHFCRLDSWVVGLWVELYPRRVPFFWVLTEERCPEQSQALSDGLVAAGYPDDWGRS